MSYIPEEVLKAYAEPHRRFHTIQHIYNMLEYCGLNRPTQNEHLFNAIVWHDFIYDPSRDDNEERSAMAWLRHSDPNRNSCYTDDNDFDRQYVAELIRATKKHYADFEDNNKNWIVQADTAIFKEEGCKLIQYEDAIFYEYQKFSLEEYKEGRLEFLKKYQDNFTSSEDEYISCDFLINYVTNKQYKIGVYAGSFNPFHIGHEDIVTQAEGVFDKVIIAQGHNRDKVQSYYIANPIQEFISYDGLLVDVFKDNNYSLIRGLRNTEDLTSEIALKQTLIDAGFNNPVVYFTCKPELQHISSSMIRSLQEFGVKAYEKYLS
jgi:cytidyltransferase-like protein